MLVGNCAKRDSELNVANVVLRSGTIHGGGSLHKAYPHLNGATQWEASIQKKQ